MVNNIGRSESEDSQGGRIQILGTNPDNPDEGRIFVWTKTGWFERLEGQSGNIAFTPVADSEEELRELISRNKAGEGLHELGDKYTERVYDEFLEQALSDSRSRKIQKKNETDEDDQEYHQHGL